MEQSRGILSLSSACGGKGALTSISIFANTPIFEEAAELVRPYVAEGRLRVSLHLNLVEGFPCSEREVVSQLIGDRGSFKNNFISYLNAAYGPNASGLKSQLRREIKAQIERYIAAFPEQKKALCIDTHQHIHAIPMVLQAILEATNEKGCTLASLRNPYEPFSPHLSSLNTALPPVNVLKNILIKLLLTRTGGLVPNGCKTPVFSGLLLSGRMQRLPLRTLRSFEHYSLREGKDLQVLFHPVSVPATQCLDPLNTPFSTACSSKSRDEEARYLASIARQDAALEGPTIALTAPLIMR